MEQLKMQTPDMTDANIEKIGALFPNCITERKNEAGVVERAIDFDRLRQELSKEIVEGPEERYQFTWPDKRKAMREANRATNMTLRPCREESEDFDHTQNLYIEGDNLEVLKCLRETYLGKVKMIYIDPPYNTGNDFVYNDDFAQEAGEYIHNSGQYDQEGKRLVQNTESNGRFHTDWLNMIYPRLKVAKDLLSEDGVIFISIDENELGNLQKITDEIFGEGNFIAPLIWAAGRKNDSKYISVSHEYILCYVRNIEYLKEHKILWREKKQGLQDIYSQYDKLKKIYFDDYNNIEKNLKAWYKSLPDGHPAKDHKHYSKVDKNGIYFAADISWPGGGGPKYQVLHPLTGKPVRVPSRGWITNEGTLKEWIKKDKVDFGEDETFVPTLKAYLKDMEYAVPYSVFYKDGRAASKRLAALMGDKVFENPKDEEVIARLLDFSTTDDNIVLDFFSGSGTTAHSVFIDEVAHNKKIKFILVQIPEEIDPSKEPAGKARKVAENAVALLDSIKAPHNICEIGKERIRRAGKKIKEEHPEAKDLDTGFRVLKLDSSNMKDVFYTPGEVTQQNLFDSVENVKEDRSGEDLLFQVMLECNIPLTAKVECLDFSQEALGVGNGNALKSNGTSQKHIPVWSVNDGYLLACFERGLTEEVITEIAKRKPYYFVMRDAGFKDDNTADNFDQIFAYYSKETIRRVI